MFYLSTQATSVAFFIGFNEGKIKFVSLIPISVVL